MGTYPCYTGITGHGYVFGTLDAEGTTGTGPEPVHVPSILSEQARKKEKNLLIFGIQSYSSTATD